MIKLRTRIRNGICIRIRIRNRLGIGIKHRYRIRLRCKASSRVTSCSKGEVSAGRSPGSQKEAFAQLSSSLTQRTAVTGSRKTINKNRGQPSRLRSLVRQIREANQPLIVFIGLTRHLCLGLVVPQVLRHSSLHLHSRLIASNIC